MFERSYFHEVFVRLNFKDILPVSSKKFENYRV